MVFSPTHEKAVEAQHLLSTWLGTRGLRLSGEKTHIRHLREGFNFLGFNVRHYPTPNSSRSGYKLLIKPSPDSIRQIKRKLKGLWRKHVGSPTVALINEMNPVIRGWSNYFRIGVAKEVFAALDRFMYERAQRYMQRRHPRKSGWWRTQKYWGRVSGRQPHVGVLLERGQDVGLTGLDVSHSASLPPDAMTPGIAPGRHCRRRGVRG